MSTMLCLVQGGSPSERGVLITRFIDLAMQLLDLRNYGSVWSVITGLNVDIVSRLQHSWAFVPSQSVEQLKVCAIILFSLCCQRIALLHSQHCE